MSLHQPISPRLSAIVDGYRHRRFAWLFFSLLLTLGVAPVFESLAAAHEPLKFLLAISLVAAIASAAHERWFQIMLALGIAFFITRGIQTVTGTEALLRLSQVLWIFAALFATATTARHAFRSGPVDAERVFAALDAYLRAGLIWGVCYWLIDQIWPASFGAASENPLPLAHAVYFSFVTIATLGYGDIVPMNDLARGLAILEAVSGQLYLTVLVARLVSLYARQTDD